MGQRPRKRRREHNSDVVFAGAAAFASATSGMEASFAPQPTQQPQSFASKVAALRALFGSDAPLADAVREWRELLALAPSAAPLPAQVDELHAAAHALPEAVAQPEAVGTA